MDKDKAFDNPTLIEAWRTAPYMHDGSVEAMDELIRIHNPYGKSSLSEKERAALAEFVLSL
jgi:cytochrome c peroxidase